MQEAEEELPWWEAPFRTFDWKSNKKIILIEFLQWFIAENYLLETDEWKFDVVPEIMDGKNIADFIDPEILEKLEELEKEEDERTKVVEQEMEQDDGLPTLSEEQEKLVEAIRDRKKLIIQKHRDLKGKNSSALPRKVTVKKKNRNFSISTWLQLILLLLE